jgi:hypothetical protein
MPAAELCLCVLLQAINAFVKQMSLSGQEFMSRKQLVDLVVSYHFIPGAHSSLLHLIFSYKAVSHYPHLVWLSLSQAAGGPGGQLPLHPRYAKLSWYHT